MTDSITVERKDVPVENPAWLKKCPQCDMNDMEIQIELDSEHRQIRFPLCKPCAEELRKCLDTVLGI